MASSAVKHGYGANVRIFLGPHADLVCAVLRFPYQYGYLNAFNVPKVVYYALRILVPGIEFGIIRPCQQAVSYFAAEYQLTQLCIEMDGKEPSPAQLKELVDTARANNTRVVFIQQEFDQKNAELIARETGCKLVRINPLSYNWHEEMILIAQSLKDAEAN